VKAKTGMCRVAERVNGAKGVGWLGAGRGGPDITAQPLFGGSTPNPKLRVSPSRHIQHKESKVIPLSSRGYTTLRHTKKMASFLIDLQSHQVHREYCSLIKHPLHLGSFQTPQEAIQHAQTRYKNPKVHACYFCSKDHFERSEK